MPGIADRHILSGIAHQLLKEAESSDITLLNQLASGGKSAFTALYLRYSANVYNALMVYVRDEYQAEDLLQNVFIKVWENRTTFSSVENIESYLFMIARNMVLNHLRHKAVEANAHKLLGSRMQAIAEMTDSRLLEREYSLALQEAVDALPAQQREAYLLATEGSLSYEAIAGRMGLSRLTVKKHLELARKAIRTQINARFPGCVLLPLLLAPGFIWHN